MSDALAILIIEAVGIFVAFAGCIYAETHR